MLPCEQAVQEKTTGEEADASKQAHTEAGTAHCSQKYSFPIKAPRGVPQRHTRTHSHYSCNSSIVFQASEKQVPAEPHSQLLSECQAKSVAHDPEQMVQCSAWEVFSGSPPPCLH